MIAKLKSTEVTLCTVCNEQRQGVEKMKTGYKEFVFACPDCTKNMKGTLSLLNCTTEWVLKSFETHKRSSKQFVLTPLISRG